MSASGEEEIIIIGGGGTRPKRTESQSIYDQLRVLIDWAEEAEIDIRWIRPMRDE